jgi:hypothetical protein
VSPASLEQAFQAVSGLSREDQLRLIARVAARLAPELASHRTSSPSPGCNEVGHLDERFRHLVTRWKAERGPTSFVAEMVTHPAYQQIIGLGPAVVPLLLGELEREPDHWFWALRAITGVNPVPSESRGKLPEMAKAWIRWGHEQGMRW